MTASRIAFPLALGFGLLAGGINFYVVRGINPPIDLVGVRDDTKAGVEIRAAEMLVKVRVRSEAGDILKSAVPWVDRGILLNRKLQRPLQAGEVVLFADVLPEGADDVAAQLKPGEVSLTFPVRAARVAPGLRPGDPVAVVLAPAEDGDEKGGQKVVPTRLLSLGEREAGRSGVAEETRRVTVAVRVGPGGGLGADGAAIGAALVGRPDDRRPRVVAVEFYRLPGG